MPTATTDLHLSLAQAGILPFAFFYSPMPFQFQQVICWKNMGHKFVIILAFVIGTVGSLIFSVHPNYLTYLAGLFIVGACVAMLQNSFLAFAQNCRRRGKLFF